MNVAVGERYRGRYEVIARLGEGAFAHVFRAHDPETGQDVALKVLKEPFLGEREVVERFQREVFAIAAISSPHVVKLLDFGFAEDGAFMVTELVEGPSLRSVIDRVWTATDVHVIVGQIAHALQAAHAADIVHRDLKPENVLLVERPGGEWIAKVLDFGFAKLASLQRQLGLRELTQKGSLFGTPQYLSPEQIRGQPFDGRADLFALGVITFEMITGERPWDGKRPGDVMTAILKSPLPVAKPRHESLIGRATEVNAFLRRVLAREKEERPLDADAFFVALGEALFEGGPPLPGATPERPLDRVSSQSVRLRLRSKPDATLYDTPAFDESDTIAISTQGKDTDREAAIPSGWYVPPDVDSGRRTLPRQTLEVAQPLEARSPWKLVALIALLVVVAVAAFWLGLTWRS